MNNQNLIFKSYFIFVMLSSFLAYFTSSGIITFGFPVAISLCVLVLFFILKLKINAIDWLVLIFYFSFSFIGLIYYYLTPYKGYLISQYVVYLLTFPFAYLSLICLNRQLSQEDFFNFFNKLIIYFSLGQVFITVGQFSHYLYGSNFKVNEDYQNIMMISGTFYNSNDLAIIVVLMAFIFKYTYKYLSYFKSLLVWFIFAYLLFITGSRVCFLLFTVIIFSLGGLSYKKIFSIIGLVFSISALLIFFGKMDVEPSHPLYRIVSRINSFQMIFEDGFSSDDSMSDRSSFYLYFLKYIGDIGIGSVSIGDYHRYANHSYQFDPLFFVNPHAFIFEIAYWMGWLGLFICISLYLLLVVKSNYNLLFVVVCVATSFVSSSLLGQIIYFLLVVMACWVCYLKSIKN